MKNLVDLVAELSSLLAEMEESAGRELDRTGLTLTQMHYLEMISLLGNPNLTELAAKVKHAKPTVKVAVDRLVEKGFVFKVRSDADRRSSHFHLTEKGMLVNRIHDQAHRNIARLFKSRLEPEELEQLSSLLNKITQ
ncbi:MAG: MarR family winged helix-turn-helix transcriptional regulator [Bacteroidota bacterium]